MRLLVVLVAALCLFIGFKNGREYEKERGVNSSFHCEKLRESK